MIWILCTIGCTPTTPPPIDPDSAALCGRVYGSTTDTLATFYAASTEPEPTFLNKKSWVQRCLALGLSHEQLRCADPKFEMSDPSCTSTLEPVRDRLQQLQDELIIPPRSQP